MRYKSPTFQERISNTRSVILAALCLTASSLGASAEDKLTQQLNAWKLEALPPQLALRVNRQEQAFAKLGLDQVPRGVYSHLKLWPPDTDVLRVCFFGGPQAVRHRIAEYATQWTQQHVYLKFDFGTVEDPRLCSDDTGISQIRIGFDEEGYWSLVGQDSIQIATQSEKSMNLSGFDEDAVEEEEFRRVVLHEFGHALGFEHEHQNPFSKCENEFNWPRIYQYLEGPPNNWTKEIIDHNMRSLHESGLIADAFDPDSIMLYTFPADYFERGQASSCFASYNTELSAGDRRLVERMYPEDRLAAVKPYQAAREMLLKKAESAEGGPGTKAPAMESLNRYLPSVH